MATFSIDLSNLPAILAALGGGLELAFITADGVTWTAALMQQGQPNYVYQGTDISPGAALAALVQAVKGQVSTDATGATAKATAVAAATGTAVQPSGALKTQGAT